MLTVTTTDIGLVISNNIMEGWPQPRFGGNDEDQYKFESRKNTRYWQAPQNGTWEEGDIIYDITPTAGGFLGWVCVLAGTFGAATDATGDTDGATAVITGMTDTSDFAVGSFVNVSAGFPTTGPYRVRAKTSTTLTLETNSDSAQVNITVDTTDPTFKTFGVISA